MATTADTVNVTFLAVDKASGTIKGLESSLIRMVGAVAAAMAALRTATFPITEAASFQKEMLNVEKTTGFTGAELRALALDLRRLSAQVDVSATDLAKIAAAAGQLGLKGATSEIAGFVDSVARIASVLDVDVTKAAEGVAKIQNIYQLRITETEKIGSLLNELSNNSTMNGEDAFDIIQRIGTAGNTLTLKQAGALAAYGKDLGFTNEVIGTSFNKIFLDLQAKADDISTAMGISVSEWANKVRFDGIGALQEYVSFLNKLPTAQRAAFAERTTGGGRLFAVVTNMLRDEANGWKLLNKEMTSATEGFDKGKSAIREQETVLQGFLKQLKILGNVVGSALAKEGEKALPFLTEYVKKLQAAFQDPAIINGVREFMAHMGQMAVGIIKTVEAVGKFLASLSALQPLLLILAKLALLKTIGSLGFAAFSGILGQINKVRASTSAWLGVLRGTPEALAQARTAALRIAAANAGGTGAIATGGVGATTPLITRLGVAYGTAAAAATRVTAAATGLNTALAKQAVVGAGNARAQALHTASMTKYAAITSTIAALQNRMIQRQQELSATGAGSTTLAKSAAWFQGQINAQTVLANREAARTTRIAALVTAQQNAANAAVASARAQVAGLSKVDQAMARTVSRLGPMGAGVAYVHGQLVRMGIAAQGAFASMGAAAAAGLARVRTNMATAPMATLGAGLGKLFTAGFILMIAAELLDMVGLLTPIVDLMKSVFFFHDTSTYKELRDINTALVAQRELRQKLNADATAYDKFKADPQTGGKIDLSFNPKDGGASTALEIERASKMLTLADAKARAMHFAMAEVAAASSQVASEISGIDAKLAQARESQKSFADIGLDKAAAGVGKDILALEAKKAELIGLQNSLKERTASIDNQAKVAEYDRTQTLQEQLKYYDEAAIALGQQKLAALEAADAVAAQAKVVEDLKNRAAADGPDGTLNLARAEQALALLQVRGEATASAFETAFRGASINASDSYEKFFAYAANKGPAEVKAALLQLQTAASGELTITAQADLTQAQADIDKFATELTVIQNRKLSLIDHGADAESLKEIDGKIAVIQERLAGAKGRASFLQQAAINGLQVKKTLESGVIPAATRSKEALLAFFTLSSKSQMLSDAMKAIDQLKLGIDGLVADSKNRFERLFSELAGMAKGAKEAQLDVARSAVGREQSIDEANIESRYAFLTLELEKQINQAKEQGNELSREEETILRRTLENNKQRELLAAKEAGADRAVAFEKAQQDAAIARAKTIAAEIERLNKSTTNTPEQVQARKAMQQEFAELAQTIKSAGEEMIRLRVEQAKMKATAVTGPIIEGASASGTFDADAAVRAANAAIDPISAKTRQALGEVTALGNKAGAALETSAAALSSVHEKSMAETKKALEASAAALGISNKELADFMTKIGTGEETLRKFAEQMKALATPDFAGTTQNVGTLLTSLEAIDTKAKTTAEGLLDKFKAALSVENVGVVTKPMVEAFTKEYRPVVVPTLNTEVMAAVKTTMASLDNPVTVALTPDGGKLITNIENTLRDKTFTINTNAGIGGIGGRKDGGYIGSAMGRMGSSLSSIFSLPKFAGGGSVRGAGTSRSDSILSWLSHGEFVNDAFTVRTFGAPFFQWLKAAARDSSARARVAALPAFADGGPVGVMGTLQSFANGTRDSVDINFNIGKDRLRLSGSRDEARKLTKALHDINKGL